MSRDSSDSGQPKRSAMFRGSPDQLTAPAIRVCQRCFYIRLVKRQPRVSAMPPHRDIVLTPSITLHSVHRVQVCPASANNYDLPRAPAAVNSQREAPVLKLSRSIAAGISLGRSRSYGSSLDLADPSPPRSLSSCMTNPVPPHMPAWAEASHMMSTCVGEVISTPVA